MQKILDASSVADMKVPFVVRVLFRHPLAKLIAGLFTGLLIFWIWINMQGLEEGSINNSYGLLYPIISLIGGLYGIISVAPKWGGYKTVMGRGILFLSLGLLAEVFGQWAWSYFTIVSQIEVPYPSVADVGYFLIVPLYSYAMYNFAIAAGVKFSLRRYVGKLQAVIIPAAMIAVAYFLFLRHVEIDLTSPIRTFLDFGYPGFEAIAISISILTYSLSRGVLGGVMHSRILYLVVALMAQYITDYTFLFRAGIGTYYNAGPVDLMYTISLTIMALGIISFNYIGNQDDNERKSTPAKVTI